MCVTPVVFTLFISDILLRNKFVILKRANAVFPEKKMIKKIIFLVQRRD